MPAGISDLVDAIADEGMSIVLDFKRTSPTSGLLSWNVPNLKTYNGFLVLSSPMEFNQSNYPISGEIYKVGDRLSFAEVIGAFYLDLTTKSMIVSGIQSNVTPYFVGHLITAQNQYCVPGVSSFSKTLGSKTFAGDIAKRYEPPIDPVVGQIYFDEEQQLILVWNEVIWEPTTTSVTITSDYDPIPSPDQRIGDFYYNRKVKRLRSWNGDFWINAETENLGVPMMQKPDVGTDVTSDERSKLINVLKVQMGWPKVCVELSDVHFNVAIDNALNELRKRSDSAYNRQYFFMNTKPEQQTYYLNDPALGTNKIVDVIKIHRVSGQNFGTNFTHLSNTNNASTGSGGMYGASSYGIDLVSVHLLHNLEATHKLVFAGDISFNWREPSRELTIFRKTVPNERILVEAAMERSEQELMLDRWTSNWIQNWAESESLMTLSRIRGKFSTIAGPGGGISLNADSLMSDGKEIQADCLRQITDMEVGQNGPNGFGNCAFVLG